MIAQSYTHLSYDLTMDWQFQQTGNSDWHPARVPGCIHLDLLNNKLIEDPFYRDNEAKVQWIENKDWEYRLIFDVPAEILLKKHIQLIFEGLDTYATIKINGQKIITANNMFHPWKADVKSLLNKKGNELRILFHSPIQEILPKLEKIDHKLPAASDPSIGTSPYTRKAPYHYGWDWGPQLVTSGIWQPVKLDAWENIKISDQQFITRQLNENKAHIEVIIYVLSDVDTKAFLKIFNDKSNCSFVDEIRLRIGLNKIKKEIEIGNPKLWWPNNFDEQLNQITQLP
ncbi:MAG: glycoside hydrolase family 2 protein, partial [bacterium]